MNNNKTSRSFRIIMIEIILMLAVLSVMSVIIVKMFLSANRMMNEARDYSKAIIKTEYIAEHLKGSSSFEEALINLGMEKTTDKDISVYHEYYGHDWEKTSEPDKFIITVHLDYTEGSTGKLEKAVITTSMVKNQNDSDDKPDSICELNVSKFIHN